MAQKFPAATIAYYGPDDQHATKVVVAIIKDEDSGVADMRKWTSEENDVRWDDDIGRQMKEFTAQHDVKQAVVTDGIIGCPHEEGIDYPMGEDCPDCPFWAGRNRFSGELVDEQ